MRDPYSAQGHEPHLEGSGPLGSPNVTVPSDMLAQFQGKSPGRNYAVWIALGASGLAVAFIAYHELTAPPDPGSVIVTTRPDSVSIIVDGKPTPGQPSPATLEGLSPEVEHVIEVQKEGFKPQTMRVRLAEAEVKTLPPIVLEEIKVDTGFTLDSVPQGATVAIDGVQLPGVTPVRVTDLAPGQHVVRVANGFAYEAWEGPIEVSKGQMLSLPPVTLVALSKWKAKKAERAAAAAAAAQAENPVTPPAPAPASPTPTPAAAE
jgi:hypothetical protein